MPDEIPTNRPAAAPAPVVNAGTGPGSDLVSVSGIFGLTFYLAAMIGVCLYGLIVFWPAPPPWGQPPAQEQKPTQQIDSTTGPARDISPAASPAASAKPGKVAAFGREFEVWDEVRLLWIVLLAGALGSLIHAMRSVYW